jgi:trimethylamine corrinoid protein
MSEEKIIEGLKNAVINYDVEGAGELAKKALDLGIDPIRAIEEGLAKGIREVGEKFAKKELFLPELIMAAETMKNCLKVFEPELQSRKIERKSLGKVLIGTVAGDIHDIGKTIVAALLTANGFEVIDLGVDVSAQTFVKGAKELRPQIVALSALLTTSLPQQREVIENLKKEGIRNDVKVMVGGAPVGIEWAEEIGADGYGANATEAVDVAKRLTQTF